MRKNTIKIKQPNLIVDASYSLSKPEKILVLAAYRFIPNFSEIPERDWITVDLKQLYGYTDKLLPKKEFYRKMREALYALQAKTILLPNTRHRINWMQETDVSPNDEYLRFRLSTTLAELFLQIGKLGYYTQIDLRAASLLRSTHAIRIYELLKHWSQSKNIIRLNVDDLKNKLGIMGKYLDASHFRKKVIDAAIADINTYTEIKVTQIKPIKTGRKITAYDFTIDINSDGLLWEQEQLPMSSDQLNEKFEAEWREKIMP